MAIDYSIGNIKWAPTISIGSMHIAAIIGLFMLPYSDIRYFYAGFALYIFTGLGITAGNHRLWTHKSYKASWILNQFLFWASTMAGQLSIIHWCRDHRSHHLHSDTELDPHNANEGFFYSHCGWLLLKRKPNVVEALRKVNISDLQEDPLMAWQHKHWMWLTPLTTAVIPTLIFGAMWGSYAQAFYITCALRWCWVLNCTWLVNSLAHYSGSKQYDPKIVPAENRIVSLLALGEGYHNYHHTFQYDYKTSEAFFCINPTTFFLKACEFLGLAYDLQEASPERIAKKKEEALKAKSE